MHPPFHFVDHKIGPHIRSPDDLRHRVRRSAPARLDLSVAAHGFPPVPYMHRPQDRLDLPRGVSLVPYLQLVPPPKPTLRDVLGRFLIRVGQRLILQNRPQNRPG